MSFEPTTKDLGDFSREEDSWLVHRAIRWPPYRATQLSRWLCKGGSGDGCRFMPPDEPSAERFRNLLEDRGLTVLVRRSRGRDILAACGQPGTKADKTS